MAGLKDGTLRITVTEAALQMLGKQSEAFHQRGGYLGGVTGPNQLRPEYLAQCDKCLTFMAREEVGYRDESRTECRDCHEHDWRCEEEFGEDNLPEEGAPLCDYHADSPGWDECTDGQECSHRSKTED